jgi:hypothetical protein
MQPLQASSRDGDHPKFSSEFSSCKLLSSLVIFALKLTWSTLWSTPDPLPGSMYAHVHVYTHTHTHTSQAFCVVNLRLRNVPLHHFLVPSPLHFPLPAGTSNPSPGPVGEVSVSTLNALWDVQGRFFWAAWQCPSEKTLSWRHYPPHHIH